MNNQIGVVVLRRYCDDALTGGPIYLRASDVVNILDCVENEVLADLDDPVGIKWELTFETMTEAELSALPDFQGF
jgi:hypothetical protein